MELSVSRSVYVSLLPSGGRWSCPAWRERPPVGRWGFALGNRRTMRTKVCGLKMTNALDLEGGCPRDQPEPRVPFCVDTLASSALLLLHPGWE